MRLREARTMEFYREVGSTNDVVKQALAQGCEQGFCAVALKQTAGYGRQGRAWSSPAGGLYFSVALRPAVDVEKVPTLALLAALAIRQGIVRLQLISSSDKLLIKWPNDVVVAHEDGSFRKMCGISSEYCAGGVCIGMGINILRQANVQTDGRYLPGYISDIAGKRFKELAGFDAQGALKEEGARVIARSIVDELVGFMPLWEKVGFAPFAEKYNDCSYLNGRNIAVANTMGAVQTQGVACGVDAQGQLLIETPQGEKISVVAGEAHLV